MNYRTRMREVKALQWTAHNIDEMRAFCPSVYTVDSGWALAIPVPESHKAFPGQGPLIAQAGYYVVLTEAGLFMPMQPAQFEKIYEPAT